MLSVEGEQRVDERKDSLDRAREAYEQLWYYRSLVDAFRGYPRPDGRGA